MFLGAGFLAGGGRGGPVLLFSGVLRVVSLSGATLVHYVWGWVDSALPDVGELCPALFFW